MSPSPRLSGLLSLRMLEVDRVRFVLLTAEAISTSGMRDTGAKYFEDAHARFERDDQGGALLPARPLLDGGVCCAPSFATARSPRERTVREQARRRSCDQEESSRGLDARRT